MRRCDRLDIAFVVLVMIGVVAVVSMASSQEIFKGVVYATTSVRDHVALRVGDETRIQAGLRSGLRFVLVDKDGIYPLQGEQDRVGAFSGQTVTMMGSYAGDAIRVSSVYRSRVAETPSR